MESRADSIQHGVDWSPEMFGITAADVAEVENNLQVDLVDGYHRTGAIDILKNRPHLLLNPDLEIDWEIIESMYPKWVVRQGAEINFSNAGLGGIVPVTVYGILLKPDLGLEQIFFIGSQVNRITQNVISNTIYDDFAHVKSVVNQFKTHLETSPPKDKKKFSIQAAYDYYTQINGRPPVIAFRPFQKLSTALATFDQILPLLMESCSTSFGGRGLTKVTASFAYFN